MAAGGPLLTQDDGNRIVREGLAPPGASIPGVLGFIGAALQGPGAVAALDTRVANIQERRRTEFMARNEVLRKERVQAARDDQKRRFDEAKLLFEQKKLDDRQNTKLLFEASRKDSEDLQDYWQKQGEDGQINPEAVQGITLVQKWIEASNPEGVEITEQLLGEAAQYLKTTWDSRVEAEELARRKVEASETSSLAAVLRSQFATKIPGGTEMIAINDKIREARIEATNAMTQSIDVFDKVDRHIFSVFGKSIDDPARRVQEFARIAQKLELEEELDHEDKEIMGGFKEKDVLNSWNKPRGVLTVGKARGVTLRQVWGHFETQVRAVETLTAVFAEQLPKFMEDFSSTLIAEQSLSAQFRLGGQTVFAEPTPSGEIVINPLPDMDPELQAIRDALLEGLETEGANQ